MKPARVRVIVCDGSRSYSDAFRMLLEYDGKIEVVAVHDSAEQTMREVARLAPDLVTMDAQVSGVDALAAIGEIMSAYPVPILLMSRRSDFDRTAASALEAGALEAVAKDDLDITQPAGAGAAAFRRRVTILAAAPVIRHPRARLAHRSVELARNGSKATVVGICASTGGPQALRVVLAALPADYPLPILVVQHIAAGFTDGLVRWLAEIVALPVRLAADGIPAAAGVWVACEGTHLVLDRRRCLRLDPRTAPGAHKPSGDVLLLSLAEQAADGAVAVILSGMGSDGSDGLAAVGAAGGVTIAQDEATSAIYGMPRAAAERGAGVVLPLDAIGPALTRLANGRA